GQKALETAFATALEHSERADSLLVVVDQFEELFTLTSEAARKPFVEALIAAAGVAPLTILLTLRADFFGQAIGLSRSLCDAIGRGAVFLGRMTGDELRRAVEEPGRCVGVGFAQGLVNVILREVEKQPGNLPLLEFALTELWEHANAP